MIISPYTLIEWSESDKAMMNLIGALQDDLKKWINENVGLSADQLGTPAPPDTGRLYTSQTN